MPTLNVSAFVVDRLLDLKVSWARAVAGIGSLAAVWFVQRIAVIL